MKPLTLGSIINRSIKELTISGSDSSSLDVYLLLEKALNKKRVFILSHTDFPVSNPEYFKFKKLLKHRIKGEPIAYILGHKEFFGYDFFVNKNVLIPRPETEWLVEESIKSIKEKVHKGDPFLIIDIGTGSGNIIISLVKTLELLTCLPTYLLIYFYASDISKKALYVAQKNAKRLLFETNGRELINGSHFDPTGPLRGSNNKIHFYHSDLFKNKKMPKKYDLVIANLPYVPDSTFYSSSDVSLKSGKPALSLPKGSRPRLGGARTINNSISFEPQTAIFADSNGTSIIKKFLNEAKNRLNKDGEMLIELDPRNALELKKYARNLFPNSNIVLKKDLAGLNRYLTIK